MFLSKSTALKAILPVAGAALAAGVIGAAAPAKAMTITLDSFTTPTLPTNPLAVTGTGNVSSTPQVISSGGALGNVTRNVTLTSSQLGTVARPNTITIGGGQASLDLGSQHSGTAVFTYNFGNAFDFTNSSLVSFDYDIDAASVAAPVTFRFTLGSQTLSQTYTSLSSGTQSFLFGPTGLSNVSSASLTIEGGSGRDVLISSPVTARRVPVPPAVLATGVGAVIGGLKAARKRKQEAVMA